jgi:hypothetical protein
MNRSISKFSPAGLASCIVAALMGTTAVAEGVTSAEDATLLSSVIRDRTIGYVVTNRYWAVHQTADGKEECPNGFNDGPREQFKTLYPEDGTKRTLVETQLARESAVWQPRAVGDGGLPFKYVTGPTSLGLNLDGKVGPNDFKSPSGEPGIDNQLYRVIGCITNYRGPDGAMYFFSNRFMAQGPDTRLLVEIKEVDSLVNDDAVTVNIYRGLDPLLLDASGNGYMPGGSQRVDYRWGKKFIQSYKGKIENGVLTTEPADQLLPFGQGGDPSFQNMRGARLKMQLTPNGAEGLLAGYVDIETFYRVLVRSWSTHHMSYGQQSASSQYWAMHKLADGYPDPATGKNTAISSALSLKFVQAFIQHDEAPEARPDSRIVSRD